MCTYKSLTREEAHKTNQVHEEQIKKTRKKICQSYHFDNRLLLLAFHCSHLDEDLLYCQVYNEWLVHLCIKDLLFPQWVSYIMNRQNLQHVRSKVPLRLCWIFTVHLHNKFMYVHLYISPELGFGEQTHSLGSLVPQPWVWTWCYHWVATQICPISSECSLGHQSIPAQENGDSLCPFLTSIWQL